MAFREEAGTVDPWRQSHERSLRRRAEGASGSFARRRHGARAAAALTLPVVLALSGGVGLAAGSERDGGASAPSASSRLLRVGSDGPVVARLQRALGVRADAVYGSRTAAAVRVFQARRGLAVDGVAGPATLAAAGVSAPARRDAVPAATPPEAPRSALLERIAACESGGDPTRVSTGGRYRGKYQFTRETWRSLGGSGDPASAPEGEQDRRAAQLLAQRGTAPWPSCA